MAGVSAVHRTEPGSLEPGPEPSRTPSGLTERIVYRLYGLSDVEGAVVEEEE